MMRSWMHFLCATKLTGWMVTQVGLCSLCTVVVHSAWARIFVKLTNQHLDLRTSWVWTEMSRCGKNLLHWSLMVQSNIFYTVFAQSTDVNDRRKTCHRSDYTYKYLHENANREVTTIHILHITITKVSRLSHSTNGSSLTYRHTTGSVDLSI